MFRGNAIAALAVLLLTGGCGTASHAPPDAAALFLPGRDEAKVFFYATYDRPDAEPWLGESFRFNTSGYEGDISAGQFIETKVAPGDYTLHADEISWGGNTVHSASLKTHLQPGGVYFFEARVTSDKLVLSQTGGAQGKKDVLSRKRECLCSPPLTRVMGDYLGL
jgi:hypothetical protein